MHGGRAVINPRITPTTYLGMRLAWCDHVDQFAEAAYRTFFQRLWELLISKIDFLKKQTRGSLQSVRIEHYTACRSLDFRAPQIPPRHMLPS